jgi:trehalose 6-phosphate synthase
MLRRALEHDNSARTWWYLSGSTLERRGGLQAACQRVATINADVVAGHYRYCNEFLWPILHDLPQFARYSETDRAFYRAFNLAIACHLALSVERADTCFTNDYQLALVPALLGRRKNLQHLLFLHIPWPRSVPDKAVPALVEIAEGLLAARRIGFHTSEYATNFLKFVKEHVPGCSVLEQDLTVLHPGFSETAGPSWTQIVVEPLGLDVAFWSEAAGGKPARKGSPLDPETPYILSVDRADYTKGVLERIAAVDRFFENMPEWRGQITLLQVCPQTRAGLPAYDRYWNECGRLAARVTSRWSSPSWQPIVWIDQPLDPEELAVLYRRARVMLVNPLRDGLNLTAKEFAACMGDDSGVLALSRHAGVWSELGQHCVEVDPYSIDRFVAGLTRALVLPEGERRRQAALLMKNLAANTLSGWWDRFVGEPHQSAKLGSIATGRRRELLRA